LKVPLPLHVETKTNLDGTGKLCCSIMQSRIWSLSELDKEKKFMYFDPEDLGQRHCTCFPLLLLWGIVEFAAMKEGYFLA